MAKQGTPISTNIFYCLLQACINKKELSAGKELHCLLMRNGFLSNVFLGCHLIRMFAACGSLLEANKVFCNLLEQNEFTWSAIILAHDHLGQGEQAITLYYQMRQSNCKADEYVFVAVLRACSGITALDQGKLAHAHIIESGLEAGVYVASALVDMYAKCGSLEDGQMVLNKLPKPSVVTWNAIIAGYAQRAHSQEALYLFQQMQQQGTEPNGITFVCIIKALSSLAALGYGKLLHAHVVKSGLELDEFIGSTLIDMYSKCGSLADAQRVFDNLSKHDIVTWSAIVIGHAQHGQGEDALQLFQQMQKEGLEPNNIIFIGILRACSTTAAEGQRNMIYGQIVRNGFDSDVCVANALVDMHVKCGSLGEARRVFNKLTQRSLVTWSTMIAGCTLHDYGEEALSLFEQMQQQGLVPNNVTFMSILQACSSLTALSQGRLIHAHMIECGCELAAEVGSTLICMYAKCGSFEDARVVFGELPKKSVGLWSAMIAGHAQQSDYKMALHYFEGMGQNGLKPDEVTYVCLLSACSHAGQVDEGFRHFKSMMEQYAISPTVDHYNCIVNLLGRAGYLTEARTLLQTMPFPPNVVGWTALLAHCKTCSNVELARHCFDQLVLMDQKIASGYVLMLDTYADVGMQEHADKVYELRKCMYAWKKPGKACIEVDKIVHDFLVNDRDHVQSHNIHSKLKRIGTNVKREGHMPHLNLVMQPNSVEDN